ncbi:glycogen debranching N-terminal domain-containing protein [Pararhodospirillum photometricum]|nr:glycogen debranching N-terminal domain-containing protein [Pararhodospirillum photometricum]
MTPASAALHTARPHTLKGGTSVAVFAQSGEIFAGPDSALGFYHRETRHLSRLEIGINGARPLTLGATVSDDTTVLVAEMTNPDLEGLGRGQIHLRSALVLEAGVLHGCLKVQAFSPTPQALEICLEFAADFADLFEVRGFSRPRRGQNNSLEQGSFHVTLAYTGLDGERRATRLDFSPPPTRLTGDSATFHLDLAPGERAVLSLRVSVLPPSDAPQSFAQALRTARRRVRLERARGARVETSCPKVNAVLERALNDLAGLQTPTPHGSYPAAGLPWFNTLFGRDSLLTAWFLLWQSPDIARGVLQVLAACQATTFEPRTDAEPGKILHERRDGEMAALGEVPYGRYYGSVDATPLFVALAGAYVERTGDGAFARALWPAVDAALAWIDHHGDRDGDGFVEYGRRCDDGLVNQGWKDSDDSVFHADGRLAQGPLAVCEVQGYVFAAKRAAAGLARTLGDAGRARLLETEAETLRQKVEDAFWIESLGTYALALDGDKRPCCVRTSNAGHLLFAGLPSPERAARLAQTLMTDASFSGWGLRTLAVGEPRYNPLSYHNGSVWPHDTALIGLGLARYGHKDATVRLLEGLIAAATALEHQRLPELFCGFPRRRGTPPVTYPGSCVPQAWAAAAPLALLGAALGLGFDPMAGRVRLEDPRLPAGLTFVRVRGLRVGGEAHEVGWERC